MADPNIELLMQVAEALGDRRAQLRAELDAYYARLYGLSREDLCYILDPASVMGDDYPSETFRVLKQNDECEFGEYRTQRLVLEAWEWFAKESTPSSSTLRSENYHADFPAY